MSHYDIPLPSKISIVSEDGNSGSYDIEGLSPGYGYTLGNSLRRIILSSLPGAAITELNIDGVDHEFSAIDGVLEDAMTIILNLKKVRFSLVGDEPQKVSLKVKGPQVVTAKDISASGDVEVLSDDQYICEVTAKRDFSIELTVGKGLGFVPREALQKEKVDIGTIAVDAIFTPIKRASYNVENMRVGDRTDYNRLRLNIETDGSVSPREALEHAVKIMLQQFKAILDLKDIAEALPVEPIGGTTPLVNDLPENVEESDTTETLKTRVENLNFSTRTMNSLSDASIRTVGGLVKKGEEDLMELEGIGDKAVEEIKQVLEGLGLSLKE